MKKYLLFFTSIFLIILAGMNCKNETNITPPPVRVELVDKTAEDSVIEHGIDAVPESNGIKLEWYPNREKKLEGYAVYRSRFLNKHYLEIGRVKKQYGITDTTFIDEPVNLDTSYYFFIRAYDELDQFGDPSDTVRYRLVKKAKLLNPINDNHASSSPRFQWNSIVTHYFIFRLTKNPENKEEYICVTKKERKYNSPEDWGLDEFGVTPLSSGKYYWRIDSVGGENEGAESNWATFIVN